jgi:uncharacterized membrane protein
MAQPDHHESDRAHRSVQAVLRVGLGAAVLAMLAGLVVCVATGQCETRRVRLSEIAGPMLPGLRLVAIGLVMLALTPAARALALVALWARARDWRFVAVALAVISILTVSVAIGAG